LYLATDARPSRHRHLLLRIPEAQYQITMIENKAFIYKQLPKGWPVPGQDLTIEDIQFDDAAAPPAGGITTKNLYAAFDPSQRGRMRDEATTKSYVPAMKTSEPVISVSVIGKVLKSDTDKFPAGSTVIIGRAFTESFSTIPASKLETVHVIEEKPGVPLTAYLGALGMTGMTAYGSLHEIGQPKKGDVILVSAAAGAVGQIVGQIAVREGLHVIGSVGDDKKLDFIVNELGFTSGFNYKKENIADAVKRLAPDGLDIYYDNVGGELLDVALVNMKDFGRIGKSARRYCDANGTYCVTVACGSISQYNNASSADQHGIKNTGQVGKSMTPMNYPVERSNSVDLDDLHNRRISKFFFGYIGPSQLNCY
jgi:NADPH-dependent curcumin reductase CurA